VSQFSSRLVPAAKGATLALLNIFRIISKNRLTGLINYIKYFVGLNNKLSTSFQAVTAVLSQSVSNNAFGPFNSSWERTTKPTFYLGTGMSTASSFVHLLTAQED
jgi:hypothetical protein